MPNVLQLMVVFFVEMICGKSVKMNRCNAKPGVLAATEVCHSMAVPQPGDCPERLPARRLAMGWLPLGN